MYVKFLAVVIVGLCMVATIHAATAAPAPTTHEGTVVSAGSGKLTMKADDGKEHSHNVDAGTPIMVHGKQGKLEDLQKGTRISVTVDNGKVTAISTVESK